MGGPGSGRRRGPARAVPRGARWRETRSHVLSQSGGICHLCGHPGATEADHIIPIVAGTVDPATYLDPGNLAAAHGSRHPCPTCGLACNQVKGNRRNGTRPQPPASIPPPVPRTQADIEASMVANAPHTDHCRCRQLVQSRCW